MALFGSFFLAVSGLWLAQAPAAKPNVVFILADDLGWADLEPYGSLYHRTPNLARLAGRSVRLTQYHAASPLCSPTRSSILTGLYPARTGITAPVCHLPQVQLEKRLSPGNPNQRVLVADSLTRLKTDHKTLANVFHDAGYATAHFGKWHLGHGKGYEARDRGFDVDIPHTPRAAGPGGGYLAPWKFVTDKEFAGKQGEHIDLWMAGKAGEFIQSNRGKPFFINFWMYSVHGPWNAEASRVEGFKKSADPKAAQRNPLYAAMLSHMDEAVGALLGALDKAGVADNTIVVFTSDNGGFSYPPKATNPPGYEEIPATSNAPLRSGKASNYEGGTRVPCLVAWPGKLNPGTVESKFCSVDWFETLTGMARVDRAGVARTDGVNQWPALTRERECRETLFVHFPHGGEAAEQEKPGFWPGTTVRKGPWKLIRFYARNDDQTDRLELYNLTADIGETRNLAAEQPAVTDELAGLISEFLKDTGAVVPKANPAYRRPSSAAGEWGASRDATAGWNKGRLEIVSSGGDPFVFVRGLPAGQGPFTVSFVFNSTSKGPGQVFWQTAGDKGFHRDRSVIFKPVHDGNDHRVELKLPAEAPIIALRIDPAADKGTITLGEIRLTDGRGKVVRSWPEGR